MMPADANEADPSLRTLQRIEAIVAEALTLHARTARGPFPSSMASAKAAYAARRQRNKAFGHMDELFEEPGWDIMLELFIAMHEGRRVCVSNACIAACVPHSTALRYVGVLERNGLVTREQDAGDRRRMFLALTPRAIDAMVVALSDRPGPSPAASPATAAAAPIPATADGRLPMGPREQRHGRSGALVCSEVRA